MVVKALTNCNVKQSSSSMLQEQFPFPFITHFRCRNSLHVFVFVIVGSNQPNNFFVAHYWDGSCLLNFLHVFRHSLTYVFHRRVFGIPFPSQILSNPQKVGDEALFKTLPLNKFRPHVPKMGQAAELLRVIFLGIMTHRKSKAPHINHYYTILH